MCVNYCIGSRLLKIFLWNNTSGGGERGRVGVWIIESEMRFWPRQAVAGIRLWRAESAGLRGQTSQPVSCHFPLQHQLPASCLLPLSPWFDVDVRRWQSPRTGWCSSRSSTGTRASPTSPTSLSSQVISFDHDRYTPDSRSQHSRIWSKFYQLNWMSNWTDVLRFT